MLRIVCLWVLITLNSKYGQTTALSFWDFYLNHSILGDAITRAREQGKAAAALAISKFAGRNNVDQQLTEQRLIIPTIDYAISTKFGVKLKTLPSNTTGIPLYLPKNSSPKPKR